MLLVGFLIRIYSNKSIRIIQEFWIFDYPDNLYEYSNFCLKSLMVFSKLKFIEIY
jgi:hypothetical protein